MRYISKERKNERRREIGKEGRREGGGKEGREEEGRERYHTHIHSP